MVNNPAFAMLALNLTAGKYFQLAGFVMLVYDHLLTFSKEVERVWKQPFSGATVLFFINRYGTPLQFIILLDAFNNPHWTDDVCRRFVLFEGASTIFLVAVAQLVMIIRVFALYQRSLRVLILLMTAWISQIVVSSIGIRTGFPVRLPPGLAGCILTGDSKLFPFIWITPLVTDSLIFLLTMWRGRHFFQFRAYSPTLNILIRDGTWYFFLIFLANLMNTLIYFIAEPDVKAIGASFSQLITATMISRLILNLRSLSQNREYPTTTIGTRSPRRNPVLNTNMNISQTSIVFRAIGNLGADVDMNNSFEGIESGNASTSDEQHRNPNHHPHHCHDQPLELKLRVDSMDNEV